MILDEKKHIIIPLLDELRKYNSSIGSYEKSMITESFDYSVKLSNGLIKLPEDLVNDYENSPGTITLDRIKSAASDFIASNSTIASPLTTTLSQKELIKRKRHKILNASIAIVIILIILIAIFLFRIRRLLASIFLIKWWLN